MTTFIISIEKMDDIMKIVTHIEESGLLIKFVSETVNNEAKEQEAELLTILLGPLGVSLLGNLIAGKGVKRPDSSNTPGQWVIRADECTIAVE